jgi:hypothetical protein
MPPGFIADGGYRQGIDKPLEFVFLETYVHSIIWISHTNLQNWVIFLKHIASEL